MYVFIIHFRLSEFAYKYLCLKNYLIWLKSDSTESQKTAENNNFQDKIDTSQFVSSAALKENQGMMVNFLSNKNITLQNL